MDGLVGLWRDFCLAFAALLGVLLISYFLRPDFAPEPGGLLGVGWIVSAFTIAGLCHCWRHSGPPSSAFYWAAAVLMAFSALALSALALIAIGITYYDPDTPTRSIPSSAAGWFRFVKFSFPMTLGLARIMLPRVVGPVMAARQRRRRP